MDIEVTSVSKKRQKLSQAGAAIFVIGQEDIRRSGATNIPDLLRLVPDVDVAQVPSEDIDRIEVIRGPGGTVWGANAVNGVIDILTKSSKATQGGLIAAGTGSRDRADTLIQYGGDIGPHGPYRVYGKYFDMPSSVFPAGRRASDGWSAGQSGFRFDWDLSPRHVLTLQGDFLKLEGDQTITTLIANALPLVDRICRLPGTPNFPTVRGSITPWWSGVFSPR